MDFTLKYSNPIRIFWTYNKNRSSRFFILKQSTWWANTKSFSKKCKLPSPNASIFIITIHTFINFKELFIILRIIQVISNLPLLFKKNLLFPKYHRNLEIYLEFIKIKMIWKSFSCFINGNLKLTFKRWAILKTKKIKLKNFKNSYTKKIFKKKICFNK